MSTICVECKHCVKEVYNQAVAVVAVEYVCESPGLMPTDWVTGEDIKKACYSINTEGTCIHYEAKEEIK